MGSVANLRQTLITKEFYGTETNANWGRGERRRREEKHEKNEDRAHLKKT